MPGHHSPFSLHLSRTKIRPKAQKPPYPQCGRSESFRLRRGSGGFCYRICRGCGRWKPDIAPVSRNRGLCARSACSCGPVSGCRKCLRPGWINSFAAGLRERSPGFPAPPGASRSVPGSVESCDSGRPFCTARHRDSRCSPHTHRPLPAGHSDYP